MDLLPRVVDNAALEEGHQTVGEHLGVDAEVAVAIERRQDGVGYGADAHLQRRTVVDQRCNITSDGPLEVREGWWRRFEQRRIDYDSTRDP